MTEGATVEKTLVEQILDAMFANIEVQDEFDTHVLSMLRQLADTGNLAKPAAVCEALTEKQV